MPSSRLLRTALLACLMPLGALAQRAYWSPEGGSMGLGKTNELSLVFEDCAPSGDVPLPRVEGVDFGRPSISNQTSIVNFRTSRKTVLTYPVQPGGVQGSFTIPTFAVPTDKGPMTVSGVGFSVGQAAVGQSGLPISEIVDSQLTANRTAAWVGEVVEVEYVLFASPRYQAGLGGAPEWKPEGLVPEAFGEAERVEATVRGERRPGVRYRTRFVATKPGRLVLEPVRQRVTLQTGERSSFFFARPQIEEFLITSNQPELLVRALPSPPPPGFTGAVGDFRLESTIVPEQVRVGDPVTWTLKLEGTGDWTSNPALPEREVSADFEVVQPRTRSETEPGKLFSGSLVEDAVLVPTKPGVYTLGPVRFVHFNTAEGAFVTREIPARTVTIEAAPPPRAFPGGAPPESALGDAAEATGPAVTPARELPGDLAAPAALPRDPLPGVARGHAPRVLSPLWWFFVAFVPPTLAWLGLAWREVLRADPGRDRRRARRALIARLAAADGGTDDLLRDWRELAIRLWAVDRAAPTTADLEAALGRHRAGAEAAEWLRLWDEAERRLFGAGASLPADWTGRARRTAGVARIRGASPRFPYKLRHWLPAAGALALALLGGAAGEAVAIEPERAYREGRFAEARASWLARVAAAPDDWIARHNLALALAQEERWAEAAAHWTSAFLLHPRDESIRANLRLALSHLDGVDPVVRRLVEPGWRERPLLALAPAEWQFLFTVGAALTATGSILWVGALFRRRRTRLRPWGLGLAVAGVVASTTGLLAVSLYGALAQPAVGLVTAPGELRSIPTDLAEAQQSSPIAPGTVVVMHDSFLGWRRVVVGESTFGWLRRESITPLFLAPAERS